MTNTLKNGFLEVAQSERGCPVKFAIYLSTRLTFPQEMVQTSLQEVVAALARNGYAALPPPFPVADFRQAESYAGFLREHAGDYDGVIAVFPNFGDESSTFTALRDAGTPILFLACSDRLEALGPSTRRDAFCGKISAMNLFKQGGVPCSAFPPHTVEPDSAACDENLRQFAAVCRVVKGMKRLRTGSIGARCTPFKTVRFDETALERYGIGNESFDLAELFRRYNSTAADDPTVKEAVEAYRNYCDWPMESGDALRRIARLSVAIERMIADYGLDLVTLRCWTELEEELKLSPCVILSMLNHKGVTANCEVDTVNALAMHALRLAAGAPGACLDWNNNYGTDEDACILFHCGPVAAELMRRRGQIGDHPMFARILGNGNALGCCEGRMKPGVFTCASGYTRGGKLVFFVEKGRFEETELPEEFFGCGGVARFENLQQKLHRLVEAGFPHHVGLSYGDNLVAVREAFSKYLGYEVVPL